MQKGVKFRIYPNSEQKDLINQTLGCCRLIYNRGLAMREDAYKNGNKIGYSQTSAMLTDLKRNEDFSFLKIVDSIALQQSLRDLDRGYANFFQKRASHPTFKSKHNNRQSYRTINQGDNIRIAGKYIKLPKDKLFVVSDFEDELEDWVSVLNTRKCEKYAIRWHYNDDKSHTTKEVFDNYKSYHGNCGVADKEWDRCSNELKTLDVVVER